MTWTTAEESIQKIPNRFDLVLIAAGRAKSLSAGVSPTILREGDKDTIVALREIDAGMLDLDTVRDSVISGMQRYAVVQESLSDAQELAAVESELAGEAVVYPEDEFTASDAAFQVVEGADAG